MHPKHTYQQSSVAVGKTEGLDSEREAAVQDVLAEVAQGTGGEFVHNNNDLQAGFASFAPAPRITWPSIPPM